MELTIDGPAGRLVSWLAIPDESSYDRPGLVLVPGFPNHPGGGANSFSTFPELADRIADEADVVVLTMAFRGLAGSEGNFSLGGWRRDLRAAIAHLRDRDAVEGIWLMGFGTGGALVIDEAAHDGDVAGVVAVAAPADFHDWASRPQQLLDHARRCGAISDDSFPEDVSGWSKELQRASTVKRAEKIDPDCRLLVLHGSSDDAVPVLDARAIADAHRGSEQKIIDGGRHHLRHDPRAMALAIGWLYRRGVPASFEAVAG
ncbi:MAG: hypothetical protein HKN26_04550 [Acidimicrobiales bacterium]|nr:hypothetical protein [Acidimicrobiales bacterium]